MLDHFDGIDDIQQAWHDGLMPDPLLTVSEWADRYRMLSPKAAAEPGRWRTERTPYLKEPMDCLSVSSPVQRVVFMKATQVGGTEAGNNWIGYTIHMAPGPMMAVSPTVELAKRNSRQRIDPEIDDVPELRERIAPARSRDSGNTVLSKEFPGGVLILTGANSAVGLRSMPARFLFLDEVDGYPGDVEGEGDPILLAERRTATFRYRRKVFIVSTPTEKSTSRVVKEFERSDQRYYCVPCPHCEAMDKLEFKHLSWTPGKPDTVIYRCPHCGEAIQEYHKTDMLAGGEWRATAKGDGMTAGFHLSSLYSPVGWFSWADAVQLYELAETQPELKKGFINTVLGEPHQDEFDAPDWHRLYERREHYPIGIVPEDGLFLTAGVDVQRDRIECEIVAWGRDKISHSVDYQVLDGNTAEQGVWKKLARLLEKDWPHALGGTVPIRVMGVDSGYATQDVYSWVRQFTQPVWGAAGARASQPRTVFAIKGRDRDTALVLGVSKADTSGKRRGLRVWNVSGPVAKTEFYRWLNLERPTDEALANGETFPIGTCHFPQYGEEYFKQLTAEKRVIRLHKGFPKVSWEKDPTLNNEALDCRVYARAAAHIYGLDRFTEWHWQRLEKVLKDHAEQAQQGSSKEPALPGKGWQKPTSSRPDDPYL